MDPEEIEQLIESSVPDASAEVTRPRGLDEDDHFAATVVSPAFEGESLVDQHDIVYDALGDRMTTDIHALELETRPSQPRSLDALPVSPDRWTRCQSAPIDAPVAGSEVL